MQWLSRLVESMTVMILTIVLLLVVFYVLLLLLDWGLKLKSGTREAEGLAELWQASLSAPPSAEDAEGPEEK